MIAGLLTLFADQPEFKGGANRLSSFIINSMVYPEYSRQNCLEGTVQVSFKVDHSGKIFDSRIQKGFGTDLDREALRIVRLTSGRWIVPAGYDTTYALVLPVNFSLTDYNCGSRDKHEISEAIEAYQAREGLTQAITNYYLNKDSKPYNASEERKVLELRSQLGYDETFVARVIRQAQTKLKQGDKESACEDFHFIHNIGSDKADELIAKNCR